MAGQLFYKERKLTLEFGLLHLWFSMIAIVANINRKSIKLNQFVTFFQHLSMFSIGFGAVRAGAPVHELNTKLFLALHRIMSPVLQPRIEKNIWERLKYFLNTGIQ
jgi:hypothetical protein